MKPTGAGAGGVLPRRGAAAGGLLGIAVSFFAASAVDSGVSTGCVGAGGRLADARRDEQPVMSKLSPLVTTNSTTVRRKFFTASVLARFACFARSPGSPASLLLPRACLKLPAKTARSVFLFRALLLLPDISAAAPTLRRAAAQFLRICPWVPCARLCSAIPVLLERENNRARRTVAPSLPVANARRPSEKYVRWDVWQRRAPPPTLPSLWRASRHHRNPLPPMRHQPALRSCRLEQRPL